MDLTKERTFFRVLPKADGHLALAWYALVAARGALPALFAIAMGVLVGAVQHGASLMAPLSITGAIFVSMQILGPLHRAVGANLGSRTSAWLYDQLTRACIDPPGIGHLEDPRLVTDLTTAREFDLGLTGPPMAINMDFIAGGLVNAASGAAQACVLFAYTWWAPSVLAGAWIATHVLLRESAVWFDRNTEEVRQAHRHADYAYRLAVDAAPSKELRLFGLGNWVVERFASRRTKLLDLQYHATRLRERPVMWSLLLVLAANVAVLGAIAADAVSGALALPAAVTFITAAAGVSMIAFGGLSWALDGAAAPMLAVMRLHEAMRPSGALSGGSREAGKSPAKEIRFRNVSFAYPQGGAAEGTPEGRMVLKDFDLTIPAGQSLAIVGQNGAGKTTLAKLLCRLYDPQSGAIEIDGVDLREIASDSWRERVTAVFQDYIRLELPLRDNVAPRGAPDAMIEAALEKAGASRLAGLDTILSRAYEGGTDLSGGQWQRVALARAMCAVEMGAGLVLLDEPTAQLDVRGEAEIFERILAATRHATTILISHRFSTVRQADRICVLEHGKVVELGSHDELMAAGGRYHTMFTLQASRFEEKSEEEGVPLDA